MPNFLGLDISPPKWRYWHAELNPATSKFGSPLTGTLDFGQESLAAMLKPLQIGDGMLESVLAGSEDLVKSVVQKVGAKVSEQLGDWSQFDHVAVAFPCDLSPLVRFALPNLMQNPKVRPPGGQGFHALEAPVAACLGLLASRDVVDGEDHEYLLDVKTLQLPLDILVWGSAPFGADLTAVQLAIDDEKEWATLRIRGWQAVQPHSQSPPLFEQLQRWRATPFAGHDLPLMAVIGPELMATTAQVVQTLGPKGGGLSVLRLVAESAAVGAAYYAASQYLRVLPGTAYRLHVPSGTAYSMALIDRICPHAVGIIGGNRAGELFWRRLWEAGTAFGRTCTCELPVDKASFPDYVDIALAETTAAPPPLWLTSADWGDYGLRLYATQRLWKCEDLSGKVWSVQVSVPNPSGLLALKTLTAKINHDFSG